MSKQIFVTDMRTGDRFQDFFMVREASFRTGKTGSQYLDITLSDKSGDINGKMWNVSDEDFQNPENLKEGVFVKIDAEVTEWQGQRQLRIGRVRLATKGDGLSASDFIKAAPEPAEDMYNFILDKARGIKDEHLRVISLRFLSDNKEKLLYYPAAVRNHHAQRAGLLYHMKRMLMMGERACQVYDILDEDWITCGVILHDMEKLTELEAGKSGVATGYSFEGQLLGHLVQGVKVVDRLAAELGIPNEKTVLIQHMIISHHYEPEFGSPKKPMFPEAEMLHYLDMLDAKLFDFEEALDGVAPGEFSDWVRTLDGRKLYKRSDSTEVK